MRIRVKLLLLVLFLGGALLVNLLALAFLARTVTTTIQTIEEVGLQQQLIAVQMQAQLRDSEAALYRYLMEGETGSKTQFNAQLQNFQNNVSTYQINTTNATENDWAQALAVTHQQASEVGSELIRLRDGQSESLRQLETTQTQLADLLSAEVRSARPTGLVYQASVSGMQDQLRAISAAITAYLTHPEQRATVDVTETFEKYRMSCPNVVSGHPAGFKDVDSG